MNKLIKFLKIIFFVVLTFVIFIATLPKENIYYKIEEQLLKSDLIIYDEAVNSSLNSLTIKNGIINYKGIDGATFRTITLNINIFSNDLIIKNLKTNQSLQNLIPTSFDEIKISYSILKPTKILLKAKSKIGNVDGNIDLTISKLSLSFEPRKNLSNNEKNMIKFMKYKKTANSKKGVYTYEYNY